MKSEAGALTGDVAHSRPDGSLMDRISATNQLALRMIRGGGNPFAVQIDKMISPVEAIVEGRPTLMFGTNSYLGLNFHPACIAAAGEALRDQGTGSTASRAASGNHSGHVALEREIAAFLDRRDVVIFSTGFLANLGVLTALAGEGDAIFLDAHCHASIRDAARLSGATVRIFTHNDAQALDALFAASPIAPARTLVVVEGLYSVWGDLADLPAIIAVTRRRGALIMVDEAHAFGTLGTHGKGACEAMGVEPEVDVIVGTFSKSLGVIGGFCATHAPGFEGLRFKARSYLFTASLPPSIVASARAALKIIASDDLNDPEGIRARLWVNARTLHQGLIDRGFKPNGSPGPVGAVRLNRVDLATNAWRAMLRLGIYVNLMIPPAISRHEAALRYSVSAAHSDQHIQRALDAFEAIRREGHFDQ